MQSIYSFWLVPMIIAAGALQAWGPPMNSALLKAIVNPWLASLISFLPIISFLFCLLLCAPRPLPTLASLYAMPWWAPLGGLIGAFAVVTGLLFVHKIGAGTFAGLTITANLIMSLLIDHYGWFGIPIHEINLGRTVGGLLMIIGIILISKC